MSEVKSYIAVFVSIVAQTKLDSMYVAEYSTLSRFFQKSVNGIIDNNKRRKPNE